MDNDFIVFLGCYQICIFYFINCLDLFEFLYLVWDFCFSFIKIKENGYVKKMMMIVVL